MEHNKRGWSWPGNWKVVCDVCQMQYPSSQVKRRWDGLIVCSKDWETRHPQTLYNYKSHISTPDFIRPEPDEDRFIHTCTIEAQSCYAGLGQAGCMRAGNQQFSFSFLTDLLTNGHE